MEKKHLVHWFLLALFSCVGIHSPAFGGPLPVSPSSEEEVAKVATNCPTFSWAQEEGASAYGIEVYELKSDQVPTREEAITQRNPVISKSIPAPALSWTPSAEACLEPGKRYVWFVKAEYKDGTNEWSEGKVFETQKASDLVGSMVEQEVRKYMEEEGLDYLIEGTGLPGDAFIVEKEAQRKAAAISGKNAGRNDFSNSPGLSPLAHEGAGNVFYGRYAGNSTTGDVEACTFIGAYAGYENADDKGLNNTYVGYASGYKNTDSDDNTYLGYYTGAYATGEENTLVGARAGRGASPSTLFTGSRNVFAGYQAGRQTTSGHDNVFIGHESGFSNQNGDYNVFIGGGAGYQNISGDNNVFIGYYSGNNTTSGQNNVFLGNYSGSNHTDSNYNTFVGTSSGFNNTSGSRNVALGFKAGYSNQTGHGNVFLGFYAGYNESGSNKLYIDNSSTSNPLIYGDFSSDILTVNGRLGIWTKNPKTALDLNGGTLTIKGTDTSAGGSRLPKLSHIETGRMDMGWGGAGGGNLEFYSLGHSRAGQFRFVYGGGDFGEIQFIHYDGSSWTNYMTLTKNGHLNMLPDGSTVRAYCDGYTWHDSSSRKFKKEIRKLDVKEAFSAFTALEPVTYKYKGTDELRVGFIAEDVPELVATKDRKSLVAMDIVAVLTKVVQEQGKKIEEQQNLIQKQQREIKTQQARIEKLESYKKRLADLEFQRAQMEARLERLERRNRTVGVALLSSR